MIVENILSRLDRVRQAGSGQWTARCPAHDDTNSSLSIAEQSDRVLLWCHAGCASVDVVKAMDLTWADLFSESLPEKERPLAVYEYRDIHNKISYAVERHVGKSFRQRALINGNWVWGLQGAERLLYRLPQVCEAIKQDRWIFYVEGEKDVHSLESIGLVATTNSGGASGFRKETARFLEGAKVVIIPDNDEPGEKLAAVVNAGLAGIAREIRLVRLPDLAPKADVSDWLAAGHSKADLVALVHAAAPPSPIQSLSDVERRDVEWWWKDRIPAGKLSIVGGLQGGGKSTLTLALACEQSRLGHETLIISYEDDPADTIKPRAERLAGDLSKIHVWDARNTPFTLPNDMSLLEKVLEAHPGISCIIVDPLVSCLGEGDAYRESDVRNRLRYLTQTGLTIVGIMHPVKGDRDQQVWRLGGSTAFTALARSVLLVEDRQIAVIKSNMGTLGHVQRFVLDREGFHWC